MIFDGIRFIDPGTILKFKGIDFVSPSPIEDTRVKEFCVGIPFRKLTNSGLQPSELMFLLEDVAKISNKTSLNILKEVTGVVVGGFLDSSKYDQNSFLLVKNVLQSIPVPDLDLRFKELDSLCEGGIGLERVSDNVYEIKVGIPHRLHFERLVHRRGLIVDIRQERDMIRIDSGKV